MLRRKTDAQNPQDWSDLALERLRAADVLWIHERVTASGVELLQEGVERLLKDYLIAHGWKLVKTHDLSMLLTEATKFDPGLAEFMDLVDELGHDFFAQHYPGMDMTHVGENYETLRETTGTLLARVASQLKDRYQFSTSRLNPDK